MEYQEVGQAEVQIVLSDIQVYAQTQGSILQEYQIYTQAQAHILITDYAYAQADSQILTTYIAVSNSLAQILTTYVEYGQATTNILLELQNYAQAKTAVVAEYQAYGQSEAILVYTYQIYAQANSQVLTVYYAVGNSLSQILTTYLVYAQAQTRIIYTVQGQAQVNILTTYSTSSQAMFYLSPTFDQNVHAQAAVLWVERGENGEYIWPQYAQTQSLTVVNDIQVYGQALAWISIQRYTLIFGDTFSRPATTAPPFNVGIAETGQVWEWAANVDTTFSSAAESTTHVDGSSLVMMTRGGGTRGYDSVYLGSYPRPTIEVGEVWIDFWVPASGDNGQDAYYLDKDWGIYWDQSETSIYVSSNTYTNINITSRNAWYRLHVSVNRYDSATVKFKLWKVGDTEPSEWITIDTAWPSGEAWYDALDIEYNLLPAFTWDYTSYNEPSKIDNLEVYGVGAFLYNQGQANAQADIWLIPHNDTPYFGQAAAYIFQPGTIYYNYIVNNDNPAAYYKLDDNQTNGVSGVLTDSIGSNTLTLYNGYSPYTSKVNAIVGYGTVVNRNYAYNSLSPITLGNHGWAIEWWVKPNVFNPYNYNFIGNSNNTIYYGFGEPNAQSYINRSQGPWWGYTPTSGTRALFTYAYYVSGIWYSMWVGSSSLSAFDWHHVVATVSDDQSRIDLYVDSVLVDSRSLSPTANGWVGTNPNHNFSEGSSTHTTAYDEYVVYNHELSEVQVHNHYALATGGQLINVKWAMAHVYTVYINTETGAIIDFKAAQTQASILKYDNQRYGQAQARISKGAGYGQAKVWVNISRWDSYAYKVKQDGAVSFWPMDWPLSSGPQDIIGNYTLTKNSSYYYDSGNTTGGITPTYRQALNFYYYGGHLYSPNASRFQGSQWTFEGWVRFYTGYGTSSKAPIFSIGSSVIVGQGGTTLNSLGNYITVMWGSTVYNSNVVVDQGNGWSSWFYLVLTYDNGIATFYVDGIQTNQWSGSSVAGNIFYLDYSPYYGSNIYQNYFPTYDGIAAYNTVLTQDQITDHFIAGKLQAYAQAQVLMVWRWGFASAAFFLYNPDPGAMNTWNIYAQANAQIKGINVNKYSQANSWIATFATRSAQARTLIIPQNGLLAVVFDTYITNINTTGTIFGYYREYAPNKPYYSSVGPVSPSTGVPSGSWETWGIKWYANFIADETGTWTFSTGHDDWGYIAIRNWATGVTTTLVNSTSGTQTIPITLTQNQSYTLIAGFSNNTGPGYTYVKYSRPSDGATLHYLTDAAPPWMTYQQPKAQAGVYTVYINTDTGAIIDFRVGQAQTKIWYPNQQVYAQAQFWCIAPTAIAQAQARIYAFDTTKHGFAVAQIHDATPGYRSAVIADKPLIYYPMDEYTYGGDAYYSASTYYDYNYRPELAADGNSGEGWATANGAGNGQWWQVAWGNPQTIKSVVAINRAYGGQTLGTGRILFSDGTTYNVTFPSAASESKTFTVDVTDVIWMRLINDSGLVNTSGFAEVQAFNGDTTNLVRFPVILDPSTVPTAGILHSIVGRRNAVWQGNLDLKFGEPAAILSGTSIYLGNNQALDAGQNMRDSSIRTTVPLTIPGYPGQENNMNVISPTWWGVAGDTVTINIGTAPASADIGIYQIGGENQWFSRGGYQTTSGLDSNTSCTFTLTTTGPHFVYLWTYNAGYTGTGTVTITGGFIAPESLIPMAVGSVITVETWVKWDGTTDYRMIFGFDRYDFHIRNGNIGFNAANGTWETATTPIAAGTWYHVVGVMYNTQAFSIANKVYVNGVRQSLSGTDQTGYFQPYFNISGWSENTSYRVYSTLDEFAIFNYELTAGQILTHYNAIPLKYAQTQARLISFDYPRHAQAQTRIADTSRYGSAVEADTPVTFYRLRETSGSIARDQTSTDTGAYGGTQTLNQTSPIGPPNNPDVKAIYVNGGSSSYVSINQLTSTFTLELWAKSDNNTIELDAESITVTSGTSGERYIWNADQMGGNSGLGVALGTNGISVYEHGDGYMPAVSVYPVTLGTAWHHIVITVNNHISRTYIDGLFVHQGLQSTRGTLYSSSLIGVGWYGNFAGYVAEPAIYNYVLSDARILAHFWAGMSGQVYGQAQARVYAFDYPQWGQALAYIGHFQFGQTQAKINSYDWPERGQANALITRNGEGLVRLIWNGGAYSYEQANWLNWAVEDQPGQVNYATYETLLPGYPGSSAGASWTARFTADATGIWYFAINSDDGAQLYINDTLVLTRNWLGGGGESGSPTTGSITLISGVEYNLHARWGQGGGPYAIRIQYKRPTDSSWYWLTDNNPPWLYTHRAYAQAKADILPIPHVYQEGQAQAQIFGRPTNHAQAQVNIKTTYRVYAQAMVWMGHIKIAQAIVHIKQTYNKYAQAQFWYLPPSEFGQAQAHIKSLDVNRYAQSMVWIGHFQYGQAKARLIAFNVNRYANANAFISKGAGYGITRVHIRTTNNVYAQAQFYYLPASPAGQGFSLVKQTYPLTSIATHYALASMGATATDFLSDTVNATYAMDGNDYGTSWITQGIASLPDLPAWLEVNLGQLRTINYYRILPVNYDCTISLQYSVNDNSHWNTIVSGVQFNVGIFDGVDTSKAVISQISPIAARWWRILVTNNGDYNGAGIASFELGWATVKSPTFAQAQVFLGHMALAQAQTTIWPAFDTNVHGQAQVLIVTTYQTSGITNAYIIPPTEIGQALADILQEYRGYAIANAWVIPPTVIGYAQARIIGFDIPKIGQTLVSIKQHDVPRIAQAKVKVTKPAGHGLALATVKDRYHGKASGLSLVYIGHFQFGNALAYIIKQWRFAQSRALVKVVEVRNAQAVVKIKEYPHAYAMGTVKQVYYQFGFAPALLNTGFGLANSMTNIEQTYNKYANTRVWIEQTYLSVANALTSIYYREKRHAQARVSVVKQTNNSGQAMVWIGYHKFSQSQARIIASNVPKIGLAAGYIVTDGSPIVVPSSDYKTYLVKFNNNDLPGYAQSESFDSAMSIADNYAAYIHASLSEYTGLKNKSIKLNMLIWEQSYRACKEKLALAATIIRTPIGFTPLYIQNYNKHYLAIASSISTSKSVGESTLILRYDVEFEAKPWLISNMSYSISGTGSISTTSRTMSEGGWTPAIVTIDSGTDISITGITADGQSTGTITLAGSITGPVVVDTEAFTVTGVSASKINKDFGLYVGPGVTNFTITGTTSCTITWRNRYYL